MLTVLSLTLFSDIINVFPFQCYIDFITFYYKYKKNFKISDFPELNKGLQITLMPIYPFQFTYINNRSIAIGTAWGKKIVVVCLAVSNVVTLIEVTGSQRLFTVFTDKVLHMPCASQCSNDLEKVNIYVILFLNRQSVTLQILKDLKSSCIQQTKMFP